jgi:hypothetical protein
MEVKCPCNVDKSCNKFKHPEFRQKVRTLKKISNRSLELLQTTCHENPSLGHSIIMDIIVPKLHFSPIYL